MVELVSTLSWVLRPEMEHFIFGNHYLTEHKYDHLVNNKPRQHLINLREGTWRAEFSFCTPPLTALWQSLTSCSFLRFLISKEERSASQDCEWVQKLESKSVPYLLSRGDKKIIRNISSGLILSIYLSVYCIVA